MTQPANVSGSRRNSSYRQQSSDSSGTDEDDELSADTSGSSEDDMSDEDSDCDALQLMAHPKLPEQHSMYIERVLSIRVREEPSKPECEEIFVKYRGLSFAHCAWVERKLAEAKNKSVHLKVKRFITRYERDKDIDEDGDDDHDHGDSVKQERYPGLYSGRPDEELPFNNEYLEAERIITSAPVEVPANLREKYMDAKQITMYLVKWKGQGYSESTWELKQTLNDDSLITNFERREHAALQRCTEIQDRSLYLPSPRNRNPERWKKIDSFPDGTFGNMQLRPYQSDGLNWLVYCWKHRRNSILADEMGLGKTAQTVATMQWLHEHENVRGPFLVIAPLVTLQHWKREAEAWTSLNTVLYHGTAIDREVIREYEWSFDDQNSPPYKFDLLITSYEMLHCDCSILSKIHWAYLAIDEAHRLKSAQSKNRADIKSLHVDHILLLTGTPIQNKTSELWTLLNLLDPRGFPDQDDFVAEFGDVKDVEQVDKLHALLEPIMLRRKKNDVETSIAAKEETIIEVELTVIQKQYYRAIYERNMSFLRKGAKKSSSVPSLMNVFMELRKCCNHPYLIKGVEESACAGLKTDEEIHQQLIRSSGKLVLIDKLLPKLKASGHKVLIFSQMVRVLDILEDYLNYREYDYERIDGSVRGSERQEAIDRFSDPSSSSFVFLLCTRAGGLGINLQVADTVIIFDSDWNPQNDLQAQARCHRIGQTKDVKVYRLITRNTYERYMFDTASKKLGLDQAVLCGVEHNSMTPVPDADQSPSKIPVSSLETHDKTDGMDATSQAADLNKPMNAKQIDSLLRYGAYGILNEGDEAAQKFVESDIDHILERATTVVRQCDGSSVFSTARFVADESAPEVSLNDPEFWSKLMPRTVDSEPQQLGPRQCRLAHTRQKTINISSDEESETSEEDASQVSEYEGNNESGGDSSETTPVTREKRGRPPISGERKRVNRTPLICPIKLQNRGAWKCAERRHFHAAWMNLGWGRWPEIRERGELYRWSVDAVRNFAAAYLCKCLQTIENSVTRTRYVTIITNLDLSKDPEWENVDVSGITSHFLDRSPPLRRLSFEKDFLLPQLSIANTVSVETAKPSETTPPDVGADSETEKEDDIEEMNQQAEQPIKVEARPEQHEEESAAQYFDDDSQFSLPMVIKYIRRNSRKILNKLLFVANLRRFCVLEEINHDKIFEDLVIPEDQPAEWWGWKEDRDLVHGTIKYGVGEFAFILSDPMFCFAKRFDEFKGDPSSLFSFSLDQENASASMLQDSEDVDDVEMDGDKQSGELEQSQTESRKHLVLSSQVKKLLTIRLKRVYRTLLFSERKALQEKQNPEQTEMKKPRVQKEEQTTEWKKRELKNAVHALMQFGLPGDDPSKFLISWSTFRANADLNKRSLSQIKEFIGLFVKHCCNSVEQSESRKLNIGEWPWFGKEPEPITGTLNPVFTQFFAECGNKKYVRMFRRILTMFNVTTHLAPLSDDELMSIAQKCRRTIIGLPEWWSPICDVGIVRGICKYGFFPWERMVNDQSLPFFSIFCQSKPGTAASYPPTSQNSSDPAKVQGAPEGHGPSSAAGGQVQVDWTFVPHDTCIQKRLDALCYVHIGVALDAQIKYVIPKTPAAQREPVSTETTPRNSDSRRTSLVKYKRRGQKLSLPGSSEPQPKRPEVSSDNSAQATFASESNRQNPVDVQPRASLTNFVVDLRAPTMREVAPDDASKLFTESPPSPPPAPAPALAPPFPQAPACDVDKGVSIERPGEPPLYVGFRSQRMYPSFVDPRRMTMYHCSVDFVHESARSAAQRPVVYTIVSEERQDDRLSDRSADGVVALLNKRVLGALDILARHAVVSSQFVAQFPQIRSGEVFFGLNKAQQRLELAHAAAALQLQRQQQQQQQQQQLLEHMRQQLLRRQDEEAQRQKQKQADASVLGMLQHLQEVQNQAQAQMLTLVSQNPQLWPQILCWLQCQQPDAPSAPKDPARPASFPAAPTPVTRAPVTLPSRVPSGTPAAVAAPRAILPRPPPAGEAATGISIATLCAQPVALAPPPPPPPPPPQHPPPPSEAIIAHIPFPPPAAALPGTMFQRRPQP